MDYLECLETVWYFMPFIFYTFVFLTLVPKSLGKINQFAKADYAANRDKWHRCYAPDICCHNLGEMAETLISQKPRKTVTRAYPKKQAAKQVVAVAHNTSISDEPATIYKRQVHTHTNVNKIAKMFENGGVQKKINRVTPTVLPADFRRISMEFEDEDVFHKTRERAKDTLESPFKKENVVLKRLSKVSQALEENNENSSNVLNQMPQEEQNDLYNLRSQPIAITGTRKSNVPNNLPINASSTTPSTVSPAHSSPMLSLSFNNSPVLPSSPTLHNAPVLNMSTSLEDLFVAIAKSAENSDGFLFAPDSTLSPVTSIDDILSQRRLSRPLSAYSISDLLNEEPNKGMDETYVENFFKVLNKT